MPTPKRKSYLLNISTSVIANISVIVTGVIMVPAALNYWHEEMYGVWILITTFISYLSLSNFGLSSATTTLVSKTLSANHKIEILKKALTIMLGYLIIILCVLVLLSLADANWDFLLGKVNENTRTQAYSACTVMLYFFVFNLGFSLLSSALIGFQKAYIDNIFQAIVPVVNLIALLVVVETKGNLAAFAIYSGIANTLINLTKLFVFLKLHRRWMQAGKFEVTHAHENVENGYRDIVITGMRFFLMSIAVVLWWNTDNIVIANALGMEEVTRYSITFKLFAIAYSLMNIFGGALNPLFAKEYALKNWEWINRTYLLATALLAFVGGGICIGGILLSNEIITLWAGESGYAGLVVVTILGVYSYFLSANNIDAGIINTCNYTKGIAWVYLASSLLKLVLSIVLVHSFNLAGVAIGTLVASALFTSWLFPLWIKKHSNGMIKTRAFYTFKNFIFLIPFIAVSMFVTLHVQPGTLGKYMASLAILIIYCLATYFSTSKGSIAYGLTILKYRSAR